MQTVSERWKSAHKQSFLNETYVEVSLDIADPEALADASSQDNGATYISDTSQVVSHVDKNVVPYCTLEQNLWVLDGGRKAIPASDYGGNGYIGDVLSNDVCVFASKMPIITLNFSRRFITPIPGITITWSPTYGEFAENFVVTAYIDGHIVAEKEVQGNRSVKSVVMVNIEYYDCIVITVKKWCLPYHRARVEEIFVGMNKVYSKTELFDYSHTQSIDPITASLPKTEIKFSIDNVSGEYNPYNEQGLTKYLMSRQEVKSRYGLKLDDGSIEWIKGGTFYLSEWHSKQNGLGADFAARDLLGFMTAIYVDNHDLSQRSLYDLAEMVLQAANLPLHSDGTPRWFIDEGLKNQFTNAPLPRDTIANCLLLIAHAGNRSLYQDRDGTLRIENMGYRTTDYTINAFNSYSKSEITLRKQIENPPIAKVYTYTMGEKGIESTATDLEATGDVIVIDNPLITDKNMAAAVEMWAWLYECYYRMSIESSWRADVRLDVLDIVTNENDYNTQEVRVSDLEFKFNGAFRGTCKGKVIVK